MPIRCFAIVALCLLSGCALGLEHVDIQYKQTSAVAPVPGADRVPVARVITTQGLSQSERVGYKKNGYGMELGGLAPSRPIADIVREAFTTELRQRGFPVQDSGATQAAVDVTKFFNDYKIGFLTSSSEADVTLAVTVRRTAGMLLYARTVTGIGVIDPVFLATPDKAREALEKALPNAVGKVMDDPEFVKA